MLSALCYRNGYPTYRPDTKCWAMWHIKVSMFQLISKQQYIDVTMQCISITIVQSFAAIRIYIHHQFCTYIEPTGQLFI